MGMIGCSHSMVSKKDWYEVKCYGCGELGYFRHESLKKQARRSYTNGVTGA